MFAIIPYSADNFYHKKNVVKVYKSQKVAQNAINKMYAKDNTINLVVREVKYLRGTYAELPGNEQTGLTGRYISGFSGNTYTVESTAICPEKMRLVWSDSNGSHRDLLVEIAVIKNLISHSKKIDQQ
jgi:hypothetical protein